MIKNGANKDGVIIEPCKHGDITRNMTPDNGNEVLYEVHIYQAKGHYEDGIWCDVILHCFAMRAHSEHTAKRNATTTAKQFDNVETITLWKRHKDTMVPVWDRHKTPTAKAWKLWREVHYDKD